MLSGPSTQENVKFFSSVTRKIKSSIRAKDSPTQDLFPVNKGRVIKNGSLAKGQVIVHWKDTREGVTMFDQT